jgi:hypothetical protein
MTNPDEPRKGGTRMAQVRRYIPLIQSIVDGNGQAFAFARACLKALRAVSR